MLHKIIVSSLELLSHSEIEWLKYVLFIRLLNFTIKIEGLSARICATILGCLSLRVTELVEVHEGEFPELGGKALRNF